MPDPHSIVGLVDVITAHVDNNVDTPLGNLACNRRVGGDLTPAGLAAQEGRSTPT